jgi:uncharacterized membrane protein
VILLTFIFGQSEAESSGILEYLFMETQMVRRLILALIALSLSLSLFPGVAQAQEAQPVVYVVLFYSPYCGHCHAFITEDLPVLQATYGDQLAVVGIDTSQEAGSQLFYATYEYFGLPIDRAGVPTFVCGDQVLIGRRTADLVALIDTGIEAGGIPFPEVPALVEAYDQALAEQEAAASAPAAPSAPTDEAQGAEETPAENSEPEEEPIETGEAEEAVAVQEENPAPPAEETNQETAVEEAPLVPGGQIDEAVFVPDTLATRLSRDPVGNGLSIVVLVGLVITLVAGISPGFRLSQATLPGWLEAFPRWLAILITTLAGVGISVTLVLNTGADITSMLLAAATLIGMAAVLAVTLITGFEREEADQPFELPEWLILVVIFAGLAAAIYLAYIEVGQEEAVCGMVGDCNAVNQSEFALLFGVLPIGVLGLIGYGGILLAWITSKITQGTWADLASATLLGMVLFGVAFSTYLTFLEPFVIGATCAWCLTSALAMIMILWLTASPGWLAVRRLLDHQAP